MATGRPTKYSDELYEQAVEYINGGYKEYEHTIPSIVGLSIILNIAKSTLYLWAENKEHPFSDILELCNDTQHVTLINKGLTGEFNSNITKLVLGKHGYSDKQETKHEGGLSVIFDNRDAETL